MEQTHDTGQAEHGPSNPTWWPSDFVDKFGSISLGSQDDTLSRKEVVRNPEKNVLSSQTASQILWSSGILSEPIPNGFYSIVPDKNLKMFDHLPTLDELLALEAEGLRADIILVDAQRDKKLCMLKQLIATLVKGLNSNRAVIIKKIAGLIADFYKRPNAVSSPSRAAFKESLHASMNRGIQMLGKIKNGSCRTRAILFKVLADAVGLESRLMVGLPNDGPIECSDSYKHMSVVVVLNSVELLVDLMRFPGQLIPRSTRAIFMTHISAGGESDSAENDSCDSPLEPNSPLYAFSDTVEHDSAEKDENAQNNRKLDARGQAISPSMQGRMLRSVTSLSLSHSEPNIATAFWRRSRRKIIAEQRTASSSPEHPSFHTRGRSMLGGDRKSLRYLTDGVAASRSEGASASETRRIRRRSVSITPEIGDDIVRAVRAMNEKFKQHRRKRGEDRSLPCSPNDRSLGSDSQNNVHNLRLGDHTYISGCGYNYRGGQSSQRAMSLPSSPHHFRDSKSNSRTPSYAENAEMLSTWNKIMESRMFNDQPLLPFQEWNIDYTEITVGTRVGIGFFGEVFRGIWNGTDVAIKVLLEQDLTPENMEDFCNEISILSRLRHPNVILFIGACTKPPRLSMVTEYMEMGSLYYLIHLSGQKKKLSWRRKLKMLRDMCRGLMCLHRMKIVHRDLKSANCLVNKHWTAKICDFGLSRIMKTSPMKDSASAGTPEWMAPELVRNEPFTEKCDIFSLGVIMWELCTLSRPWDGIPPERVVYAVANEGSRLEIPDGPLGQLIADCWAEPQERPSCEEILSRLLDCEYALC